jgi:hypothetical protein
VRFGVLFSAAEMFLLRPFFGGSWALFTGRSASVD